MKNSVCSRYFMMIRSSSKTLVFCFLFFPFSASADLLEKGVIENPKQAIVELNKKLENDPDDKESLFLKARAYENLGDVDTASKSYRALIKRFPEQPEFYLNLANIYSKSGNYKAAREVLEQGFNSNKVYGELYKNLKSLNRHLASQAYQRAMNKKTVNKSPEFTVASRLSLPQVQIKEVQVPVEVIKEVEVVKEVEVIKEVVREVRVPVEVVKEVRVPVNSASGSQASIVANTNEVNSTPTRSSQTSASGTQAKTTNVIENVRSWAVAWSKRNVSQYISFYAPNYSTNRKNRSQWIADRKIKIGNKKFIEVKVSEFSQNLTNNGLVRVRFLQSYRSNTVFDTVRKELTFKKFPAGWKIVGERIVGR